MLMCYHIPHIDADVIESIMASSLEPTLNAQVFER